MIVLVPGHVYELANFERPDMPGQTLKFIWKTHVPNEPRQLMTVHDGTTNEEVLAMMIDRMKHLNGLMPSFYNEATIQALEMALRFLNQRTKERMERGVEGTHVP